MPVNAVLDQVAAGGARAPSNLLAESDCLRASLHRPGSRPIVLQPFDLLNCSLRASLGFASSPTRAAAAAPFARTVCSSAPTTAPSPIAAPTRLTDPDRTSPAANTPGMLVSSDRGRSDPIDRPASDVSSDPVKTKFLGSKATPLPLSQLVAGSAPIKRKT
jgi:hypothetical protein